VVIEKKGSSGSSFPSFFPVARGKEGEKGRKREADQRSLLRDELLTPDHPKKKRGKERDWQFVFAILF